MPGPSGSRNPDAVSIVSLDFRMELGDGSGQGVALVPELVLDLVAYGQLNLLGGDLRQGARDTVAREPEHPSLGAPAGRGTRSLYARGVRD
jgi:hypothetical protein